MLGVSTRLTNFHLNICFVHSSVAKTYTKKGSESSLLGLIVGKGDDIQSKGQSPPRFYIVNLGSVELLNCCTRAVLKLSWQGMASANTTRLSTCSPQSPSPNSTTASSPLTGTLVSVPGGGKPCTSTPFWNNRQCVEPPKWN